MKQWIFLFCIVEIILFTISVSSYKKLFSKNFYSTQFLDISEYFSIFSYIFQYKLPSYNYEPSIWKLIVLIFYEVFRNNYYIMMNKIFAIERWQMWFCTIAYFFECCSPCRWNGSGTHPDSFWTVPNTPSKLSHDGLCGQLWANMHLAWD